MRLILSLIFCSCITFGLYADFQFIKDYYKPCLNKSESHQMANIDFIYMINLDQRPEKYHSCVEQLSPYGIYPYRFSAVNGKELPFETINALGINYEPWMNGGHIGTCFLPENPHTPVYEIISTVGRNYFAQSMGKGTIGIAMSHLSILQDAFDSGYETIWVMEDDIELVQDPRLVSAMIDKLDLLVGKDKWDILYTDRETKNKQGEYVYCLGYGWRPNFTPRNIDQMKDTHSISPDFRKIGARYGTYSMVIRRSGMEKLLEFFKVYKIFLPYDLDIYLPPDINLYTVENDIVSTQPNAISDNDAPPLGLASFPF